MQLVILIIALSVKFAEGADQEGVRIEEIANNNGIFAEKIGDLRPYSTTWKMVTHVDLGKFLRKIHVFGENWSIMNEICKDARHACANRNQLSEIMLKIRSVDEVHKHLHETLWDSAGDRDKRAVASFVGKINKILWGNLDEDDAAYYDEKIETLENTTRATLALIINETLIVKSEFEQVQMSIQVITQELRHLGNNVEKAMGKLDERIKTIEFNEKMGDAVLALGMELEEYEADTRMLVDAILFAKQGQLHPMILGPGSLISAAKEIERHEKHCEFPAPLESTHAAEFLKFSELSAYLEKEKLIFVIRTPMVELNKFTVFKHIPLPIGLHNTTGPLFSFILPAFPYTAISEYSDRYFRMTDDDIKNCKKGNIGFVCAETQQSYGIDESSDCEVQLIVNPRFKDVNACDVRVRVLRHTYWVRLHNSNTWLYTVASEDDLKIHCNGKMIEPRIIKNSGLVTVSPGCEARSRTTVLIPTKEIATDRYVNMTDRFVIDIPTTVAEILNSVEFFNISEIFNVDEDVKTQEKTYVEIKNLGKTSKSLKAIIREAKAISNNVKTNRRLQKVEKGLSYGGIALAILITLIGLEWKFSLFSKLFSGCSVIQALTRCAGGNARPETRREETPQRPTRSSLEHAASILTLTESLASEGDITGNRAIATLPVAYVNAPNAQRTDSIIVMPESEIRDVYPYRAPRFLNPRRVPMREQLRLVELPAEPMQVPRENAVYFNRQTEGNYGRVTFPNQSQVHW